MIEKLLSSIAVIPIWVSVTALLFLFGWLSYLHAKRDAKDRIYDWENMKNFEPVLGASPASFITTPLYRFFRLLGVDLLTPSGVFLALTTWLVFRLDVTVLKEAWLIPGVELAMWLLACVNFAIPKKREEVVDAIIYIMRAVGSKIYPPKD
jgi:hypothetical protein